MTNREWGDDNTVEKIVVEETDSIGMLKMKIEAQTGIPALEQRLFKELDDRLQLRHYDIQHTDSSIVVKRNIPLPEPRTPDPGDVESDDAAAGNDNENGGGGKFARRTARRIE